MPTASQQPKPHSAHCSSSTDTSKHDFTSACLPQSRYKRKPRAYNGNLTSLSSTMRHVARTTNPPAAGRGRRAGRSAPPHAARKTR